ncbi:MAG: riboflavin synthase [Phycisphaerales bacterium]
MFTGLVQSIGQVHSMAATPTGCRLVIDLAPWDHRPGLGDSIAVAGCCLTVAGLPGGTLAAFDVIHESLAKTRLGTLHAGARVNLEHAVTGSTLMGGHFVQGHIDGVGTVERVTKGAEWRITVRAPACVAPALAPKGSISLEGVSLTLAEVERDTFTVALIPVTLERTTLADLSPGDPVNLEADIIAKTVLRALEHFAPRIAASTPLSLPPATP